MESLITLIARLIDTAVWSCAAALGVALGIGVVASCGEQLRRYARRGLVFCGLGVCALLFCGKPPAGSTDGMDHVSSPLMVGVPRPSTGPTADDEPKFTAIRVTANGVDLELHRPEALMTEAVEVVLVGSTNLVAATWEPFTNAVFAAGETNVAVRVDRAQLDAHSVSNCCFFAFINAGDTDEDGLPDWHERFNLKTYPNMLDSDQDGMPDGWEVEHGLMPLDSHDGTADKDGDGLSNAEEYAEGTNPRSRDSDDDGLEDAEEVGRIVPTVSLPDFAAAAGDGVIYVCTPPVGHVDSGAYPFDLPFPVRLCGRTCTRGVADVRGVVRFLTADEPAPPALTGDNDSIPSSLLEGGVSVAAYWDTLRLRGGVSSIRLADMTRAGRRWAVVEYHTVGSSAVDSNLLTFRVAVCQQTTNEVAVQYASLVDPNEGRTATFGAQGPGGRPRLQLSCNGPSPVCAGISLLYRLGTGTDPLDADTDDDFLPDGWEEHNGLAANSSVGDDGASGDPDGDNLSNWVEYLVGSHPFTAHTFSVDFDDWTWIEYGFGMPFPEGVTVTASVGDTSQSRSEQWRLVLSDLSEGGRHYVVACAPDGAVAAQPFRLVRGRHYIGRIEHVGSLLGQPDYDWTARIDGWPQTDVLAAGLTHSSEDARHVDVEKGITVVNTDGLLGLSDDMFGAYDNSYGKTFEIYTAKTQISQSNMCAPIGQGVRIPFSLTADSDPLANWSVEPVLPDGARLFVGAFGGTGAATLDGQAGVWVSIGSVPATYTITARHPNSPGLVSSVTFSACRFKVESVRFNFDLAGATTDAVSLRSNYSTVGFAHSIGEWDADGAVNFPACYVGGVLPRVQARFSVEPQVSVTARFFAAATGEDSPLGGLIDVAVPFENGVSDWVMFTSTRVIETKVAKGATTFGWYLCRVGELPCPSLPIASTGPHRIYTVLAPPVEPWSADIASDQCAWTNALEWACVHASGATTQNEAASRITEAINSSGKFIYAQGDARYCHEEFLSGEWFLSLTECLSQLRHPDEDGYAVCCIDCAAFVVSFSNLLGCNLYSCQMQEGFDTNPIQVIGETTWRSFSFYCHEVAWTGSCGDSDFVYDACLRVDGDDSPSVPPHQALLPVGMMFSDGDEDEPFVYRERFAKPGLTGYDRCRVNSLTKRRLKIK